MASGFATSVGMNSLSMQGQAVYGLNAYCLDELTKLGEMTQEQKLQR
jgi:hypothetical protein